MRIQISIILIVSMFCAVALGATYSGGAGEPNDPFIIASANDLQQIAYEPNDWDKCFKMVTDVNLAELGRNFDIITNDGTDSCFSGVFDGNGHTISNLKCDARDVPNGRSTGVGLFKCISRPAEVKNLGIINADVNGLYDHDYIPIGTLVGRVYQGVEISNCYAENCQIKNGNMVGGLVGELCYGGAISNCYTTFDVTGTSYVGGLVGHISHGVISNCYTTGNVTAIGIAGGLVGRCYDMVVENCHATGDVIGGNYAGGLVGSMRDSLNSKITDSYSTGDVSVIYTQPGLYDELACAGGITSFLGGGFTDILNCYASGDVNVVVFDQSCEEVYVGGLVGVSYSRGKIIDCNATGDVSLINNVGDSLTDRNYTGGLIGWFSIVDYDYFVVDCYATGDVDGNDHVGGLVGYGNHITNSYATGNVTGNDYVGGFGGLVGFVDGCYATGDVNGNSYVGGFAGTGTADCSYATGDVTGNYYVGGFTGNGRATYCYATGDANGIDYVGGFAGGSFSTVYKCYSTGRVYGGDDANNVGGFNGVSSHLTNRCFWDVESSGILVGAGGGDYDPLRLQGKSTAQMKDNKTFTDEFWDFTDVWAIGQNQTYPYLRQYSAADISADGIVNFADFAMLADSWLVEK